MWWRTAALVVVMALGGPALAHDQPARQPQLLDPPNDTALSAGGPADIAAADVDLLSVALTPTYRGRTLTGVDLDLRVAGVARPLLPLAYRVQFSVSGCTVIVTAQAQTDRGRSLTRCGVQDVYGEPEQHVAGQRIQWRLPVDVLGKGGRPGTVLHSISARVVTTEGHDRLDLTVLDRGTTSAAVRI